MQENYDNLDKYDILEKGVYFRGGGNVFTYIGRAECDDIDEARVIFLTLSSIADCKVIQDNTTVMVSYQPEETTSNEQEQKSIIQIQNVLSLSKDYKYTIVSNPPYKG